MKRLTQIKAILPALLLLGGGIVGLAAARFLPADGERVAILAPGRDALGVVAAAGGLAFGGSGGAIYAVSAEPGFIDRLYRSGAWLVVRFDGAAGCLRTNPEDTSYERS